MDKAKKTTIKADADQQSKPDQVHQAPVNTHRIPDEPRTPLNQIKGDAAEIDGMKFHRSRGPLTHADKKTLDIPPDLLNPNLKYRWVNEVNGAIDKRREGGYEIVPTIKGKMGEDISTRRRVGTNKDGSPIMASLMATPKKWHEDAENAAENERKRLEQGLIKGETDGKEALNNSEFYTKPNNKIN